MFVSLLLRQAGQRAVLEASQLQRELPVRQRAEGAVPAAAVAGLGVPAEQTGAVRRARQRVAVVRVLRGLSPGDTGGWLALRGTPVPGCQPRGGRSDLPIPGPRLPPCPSLRAGPGGQDDEDSGPAWGRGQTRRQPRLRRWPSFRRRNERRLKGPRSS